MIHRENRVGLAIAVVFIVCSGLVLAQMEKRYEVVSFENSHLTVKDAVSGEDVVYELFHDTPVVRQERIVPEDFEVGESLLVRGRTIDAERMAARLVIVREASAAPPPQFVNGFVSAEVVRKDPLTILTGDGSELELELSPQAILLREAALDQSGLTPGQVVKIAGGRVVVLPAVSANAASSLPMPPEDGTYTNLFEPGAMAKAEENPFGFFDPNMLRFHHTSWYAEYAEQANRLGAGWVSFGASFSFNWNLAQERKADGNLGVYRWERFDKLVRHAQAHNLNIVGYIKSAEPVRGAVGPGTKPKNKLPKDIPGYQEFVTAVVERYDGDGVDDMPGLQWPIRHWSIEDEPMAPIYFEGTGGDYARLLAAAYPAVKKADPEALVICSMIRQTGWFEKAGDPRVFMLDFYETLQELGVDRPYDIMDLHWLGTAPRTPQAEQYDVYRTWKNDIDDTGREHGFSPAPYVNLELGGSVASLQHQAEDMVKRHAWLLVLDHRIILWSGIAAAPDSMIAPEERDGYFRKLTLIDGEGEKKPAYHAYRLMTKILGTADVKDVRLLEEKDGLFIIAFVRNGIPARLLWFDGQDRDDTREVELDLGAGIDRVQVVEAVSAIADGPGYKHEEIALTNHRLTLKVGTVPIYVLGK